MSDHDFIATVATLLALGWLAYVLVDIGNDHKKGDDDGG